MFIYSVRASSVKFFAVIILAIAVFLGIWFSGESVIASAKSDGEVNFYGIKTEEDRIAFIEQFGLKVDKESAEEVDFVMPENFDRVMVGYNEIQKAQGLDIKKYAKKKITRFTYEASGYEDNESVFVNLLVYRNRIIACDVSSLNPNGFVRPLALVGRDL